MPTMHDPAHPGESLRDALEAEGWTVTEAAAKLGCTRQTLSRVLNGRTGISPSMALALEGIGWGNAVFWVRRQTQHDLAQERIRRQQAVACTMSTLTIRLPDDTHARMKIIARHRAMSVNELNRRERPTAGHGGIRGWLAPHRRLGARGRPLPVLVSVDGATRLGRYGSD